ncbi:MAG: FtsW/RodA/SpoVE family cell cycle protein [Chthonomonadaceae bacterium]|nr:FtsW/RodA/SpoVE family cell cycle protein [Chthonomonadaceae bacterium]
MVAAIKKPDGVLFWLSVVATSIGLLAIYDAGYARSAVDGAAIPREFKSQLVSALVAVAFGSLVWFVRRQTWKWLPWAFYGATLLGLLAVKLFGTEINGATRWIDFKVFTVQPAEFAKVAVILLLAVIFADRREANPLPKGKTHWAERLDYVWIPRLARGWPLIFVLVLAGLVLVEPDLATALMVVVIAGAILLMGRVSRGSLMTLVAVSAIAVTFMVIKEPYRMTRMLNHGDRWSSSNIDGIGYQTTQSEASMSYGGFFGVGLGKGRAKHTLPAPTTDFVMATVSEETGLVGTLCVLSVLGGIVWRLIHLARAAKDQFARLVNYGTATWIGVQSCTNIVMANGFVPPIGVPMPFISAGGSSLLALWIAIGASQSLLRKSTEEVTEHEARRHRRWHRRTRISRA